MNIRRSNLDQEISKLRTDLVAKESTLTKLRDDKSHVDAQVGWLQRTSASCKSNIEEAIRTLVVPSLKDLPDVPSFAHMVMQNKRWALQIAEVDRRPWTANWRSPHSRRDGCSYHGQPVLLLALNLLASVTVDTTAT